MSESLKSQIVWAAVMVIVVLSIVAGITLWYRDSCELTLKMATAGYVEKYNNGAKEPNGYHWEKVSE